MTKAQANVKTTNTKTVAKPADSLTPEEAKKAHEKAIKDKNQKEMKAAKKIVVAFQDTAEYKALAPEIQAALKRICGKVRVGGIGGGNTGSDVFVDRLKAMFPKVGTSVDELEIFKATKMGRGEFRKRVRESLKRAEPANRMWVEFNADTEKWTFLARQVDLPEGFKGKAI